MSISSKIISSLAFVAGLAHVGSCTVSLWGQCGGSSYSGDTTCASGSTCVVLNQWYSQCQPSSDSSSGVALWGQCGGADYSGATSCVSGSTCSYVNYYFWQCQPNSSTTSTTTSSTKTSSSTTTTTTTKTSTTTTKTSTSTTSTSSGSTSTGCSGYVGTSGQKFTLNGNTFTVVGSNAYWIAQKAATTADIDQAFADIAATGATTVRTWGFNEVTSASGTYYQIWSGSTPTINYGSDGLQKFDQVVASAKSHGLKLIVALTNNWEDYGGMDVYVTQILGSADHDLFFTNSSVIQAFKNYIAVWINRYKNEPTILAWELANEPRCHGTTGTTTGTCTTSTITQWVQNISSYIKGLDSCHLVAIGDEGMGLTGDGTYPYTSYEGLDFSTNLAISTIDFGTAHLYPNSWGETSDPVGWGSSWITYHYNVQKQLNKPVILEEFGVTSSQYSTYQTWLGTVVSSGLTGDLIWQAGSTLSTGTTPQDGYAIYPTDSVYSLLTSHAAALKARG